MNGVNFNSKQVQGFGQAATNEPGPRRPVAYPNIPGMTHLVPTAGNPRYRAGALPQPPRPPTRTQTPISVCPPGYTYYKGKCFPTQSPGPGYSTEPLPQPGQPPSQPIPQIPVPGNPGPTVPPIYPGDLRGVGQGPGAQAGGSLPFPQDAYGGGNGSLPGYDVAHAGYWQGAAAGGTPVPPGTPISARRPGVYHPSNGARAGYLHGVGVGAVFLNNSTSPTGWWKDNGDGTWSPADPPEVPVESLPSAPPGTPVGAMRRVTDAYGRVRTVVPVLGIPGGGTLGVGAFTEPLGPVGRGSGRGEPNIPVEMPSHSTGYEPPEIPVEDLPQVPPGTPVGQMRRIYGPNGLVQTVVQILRPLGLPTQPLAPVGGGHGGQPNVPVENPRIPIPSEPGGINPGQTPIDIYPEEPSYSSLDGPPFIVAPKPQPSLLHQALHGVGNTVQSIGHKIGIAKPPAQGLGAGVVTSTVSPSTVGLAAALGGVVGAVAGATVGSEIGTSYGEAATRRAGFGGLMGIIIGSFAGAAIAAPTVQQQQGA